MKNYVFLTSKTIAPEYEAVAARRGVRLVNIGYAPPFRVDASYVYKRAKDAAGLTPEDIDGVVVIHSGQALRLVNRLNVGVFETASTFKEDGYNRYVVKDLRLFRMDTYSNDIEEFHYEMG